MACQNDRPDWLSVVMSSSVPKSKPGILDKLPVEILILIFSPLGLKDLKSLRLTCRLFSQVAPFSYERVFLSPNPSNIEAFIGIASDDAFRHTVTEIIYDDAQLDATENPERHLPTKIYDLSKMDAPYWYEWTCMRQRENMVIRKGLDADRPDHVARAAQLEAEFPLKASWTHYQELLRQQDEVLASDADFYALVFGFERFTQLKKITITPAAHGFLFTPLYKTPMIRRLPYGLNYALPRGWPSVEPGLMHPDSMPWDDENVRKKWRGFSFLLRLLSHEVQNHNVTELVLDVNQLRSGINCHIFDQVCEEYRNLFLLLQKPGFRRLNLSLFFSKQARETWHSFRSGLLRHALGEARDLREFSLQTSLEWNVQHQLDPTLNFTPLRMIFPVERWEHLTHFGISRFLVVRLDLLMFLAALPPTLRSVELSFLMFLDPGGCYWSLLNYMRDWLKWRRLDEDKRPLVSICTGHRWGQLPGRGIWLKDEINQFLYSNGVNPFGQNIYGIQNLVFGVGVERDAFEPAHERPNKDDAELFRMGILESDHWSQTDIIWRYRHGTDYR